jgi:ATP-dependent DNA helicase RecQ
VQRRLCGDGLPAKAVLLYRLEDKRIHDYFLRGKYASARDVEAVVGAVLATVQRGQRAQRAQHDELPQRRLPIELDALARDTHIAKRKVEVLVWALVRDGTLQPVSTGTESPDATSAGAFALVRPPPNTTDLIARLTAAATALREADRQRLATMMHYAEHLDCRWSQVLAHFGEPPGDECRRCDVCESQRS